MKQKEFILWSSEIDEDMAQDLYKETCEANDWTLEERPSFSDWLEDYQSELWNDFKTEIQSFGDCVLVGTIQRWNGRINGQARYSSVLSAILKCIEGMDFVEVKWNDGHLEIEAVHHDGTNTFSLYLLNSKGINAGDKANLSNKTYHKRIEL